MATREKRRLYIIGAIVIAAVILFLLLWRRAGVGNTIINQGGEFTFPSVSPIELSDLPPLDIPAQRASSRGCAVCYAGYGRIIAPASPAPPPEIAPQINYMVFNVATKPSPPPPSPYPSTILTATNNAPSNSGNWWQGMAPGGRS